MKKILVYLVMAVALFTLSLPMDIGFVSGFIKGLCVYIFIHLIPMWVRLNNEP